jgi:hypothetical protein
MHLFKAKISERLFLKTTEHYGIFTAYRPALFWIRALHHGRKRNKRGKFHYEKMEGK